MDNKSCNVYRSQVAPVTLRLTDWQRNNLRVYLSRFPSVVCFDLSQTATLRPRVSSASGVAPVLTSTCGSLVWARQHRFVSVRELLSLQGFPSAKHLADRWHFRFLDLSHSSQSAAGKLAGDGMHVQCVGAFLCWILAFCPWPKACMPRSLCSGLSFRSELRGLLVNLLSGFSACFPRISAVSSRAAMVFPLPCPSSALSVLPLQGFAPKDRAVLVSLLEAKVSVLNSLHANLSSPFFSSRPVNSLDVRIFRCFFSRLLGLLRRLDSVQVTSTLPLSKFEPADAPARPTIQADKIDLPAKASTCEPLLWISSSLCAHLQSPSSFLPSSPSGVGSIRIGQNDRVEYRSFVGRMLSCRKVRLWSRPSGVGSFFCVAEDGDRQRPIWHGGIISEACVAPPSPE